MGTIFEALGVAPGKTKGRKQGEVLDDTLKRDARVVSLSAEAVTLDDDGTSLDVFVVRYDDEAFGGISAQSVKGYAKRFVKTNPAWSIRAQGSADGVIVQRNTVTKSKSK